jgi:hypothetical protein
MFKRRDICESLLIKTSAQHGQRTFEIYLSLLCFLKVIRCRLMIVVSNSHDVFAIQFVEAIEQKVQFGAWKQPIFYW